MSTFVRKAQFALFVLLSVTAASRKLGAQTYLYNQTSFAVGAGPTAVVAADFNADGNLDLAVANRADNTISITLAKPDGTFAPQVTYPTGQSPVALAAADFNSDGKPDLAVVGYGSATVSILIGNGDGTFQGNLDYAVGVEPTSVAVGDFNGDGKLDVAVANQYDGTVSLLLGNDNGTFKSSVTYTAGGNPSGIAAADLNGDGKLDLVVATGGVSVLLGNGDGTFQPYVSVPGAGATALAVGDFNGDGIPDVATANEFNSTFSALIGRGDGTFSGPGVYWTASNSIPNSITAADFNGDGSQDIAVAGQEGVVTVLLNEPALAISYPRLDFGAQAVGTTGAPLPITITNVGGARLSISGLSAGGNFTETNNCVGTLAVATHCTVNVTFTPTQTGSIAGTLTVTDNNSGVAGSVQTVALSGTGTAPPPPDFTIAVASGSSSSATVSPGGTATYSLNIGSLNGFAQSVSLTCSIAASQATCAVSPTSVSPTGAAPASVTVTVRTTAPSLALPLGPNSDKRPPLIWMIGLAALLALATFDAASRHHAPRRWVPAFANTAALPIRKAMFAALFLIALALASCSGGGSSTGGGGGNSNPGTAAGTYSLTVNATSGSLSHSTTLALTVN